MTRGSGKMRAARLGGPALAALGVWVLVTKLLAALAGPAAAAPTAQAALSAIAALAAYMLVEIVVLGESSSSIGLSTSGAGRQLLVGALVGAVALSLVVLIAGAGGWYSAQGARQLSPTHLLAALLLWPAVAVAEEVVFRGMLLRRAALAFGVPAGLVVSTLAFALAHLANVGGNVGAALALGICGSLLFGVAYLATGALWLPIGMHMAWNFSAAAVFGIGAADLPHGSLLDASVQGPVWAIGTQTAIEAGAIAIGVAAATAGLMTRIRLRTR